jgi:hypothetical protein
MVGRIGRHLTYANVTATLALVIAFGGGAYAAVNAIPGPNKVIHGCYARRGGALRLVAAGHKCSKHEHAISFNQQGPRGVAGVAGQTGPSGTPDLSQFYSKPQADAQFVHGTGTVIVFPVQEALNSSGGPVMDVPAVGRLVMTDCLIGEVEWQYTNESGATEGYIVSDSKTAHTNASVADGGTLTAGTSLPLDPFNPDITQLSVITATGTADFVVYGRVNPANAHCQVWGRVTLS